MESLIERCGKFRHLQYMQYLYLCARKSSQLPRIFYGLLLMLREIDRHKKITMSTKR
jgi:hypothetical protein